MPFSSEIARPEFIDRNPKIITVNKAGFFNVSGALTFAPEYTVPNSREAIINHIGLYIANETLGATSGQVTLGLGRLNKFLFAITILNPGPYTNNQEIDIGTSFFLNSNDVLQVGTQKINLISGTITIRYWYDITEFDS